MCDAWPQNNCAFCIIDEHEQDFNHTRLLAFINRFGLELSVAEFSSERMLQRDPIYVGDLKPVGVARPLAVLRPSNSLSSLVTISISCLATLTLFAAGAAWFVPHSVRVSTTFAQRPASVVSTEPPAPSVFPPWIEVPHLPGRLAHAGDPDTFSVADGPRTFLGPNLAATAEQPLFLPPRANPRSPLIGRAPLDAARLTQEHPPVWNEHSTEARTPTEVVVRPATTISAGPPPGRGETLGPDPAQQVVDRMSPITPPRDTGGVIAPILSPEPARQARLLRKSRAVTTVTRARMPYRDADQTASIISRPRIDAGAIAHTSLHRARADRSTISAPAPSAPWTLPPALAPTD